jgi:hypothetical protein
MKLRETGIRAVPLIAIALLPSAVLARFAEGAEAESQRHPVVEGGLCVGHTPAETAVPPKPSSATNFVRRNQNEPNSARNAADTVPLLFLGGGIALYAIWRRFTRHGFSRRDGGSDTQT